MKIHHCIIYEPFYTYALLHILTYLNSAGKLIAKANKSVLIPLAPLTRRRTRLCRFVTKNNAKQYIKAIVFFTVISYPTLATRTTLKSVGDTKYLAIMSLSIIPATLSKTTCRMYGELSNNAYYSRKQFVC